jgi:hypothetical protein
MTDHRACYGPHDPDETYVAHSMHGDKPELYVETLLGWVRGLVA